MARKSKLSELKHLKWSGNSSLKIHIIKGLFIRELQGTLRITNEFNDNVQNQIVSFEEWCNFIFMEYDSSIW
jgi:hypothetical protein